MNKKISLGAAIAFMLIVAAATFSMSMLYAMSTFNEKVYRRITVSALTFYCLAKSYSFFTGANHVGYEIPKGVPGAILSSGFILPLNICVGLIVACTMYGFYALFTKGEI